MSRIRIMHVLDQLGVAGTEGVVINVVNGLDPTRFEPLICCLRRARPLSRFRLSERIPVFELHRRPRLDLRLILKLARLLRRERVDVVHSHNWSTYVYAVVAARLARVPVVIHGEHGRETQSPERAWKRRVVQRALAPAVDRFVAVSRDIQRHLTAEWGLDESRTQYLSNGVDLTRFGRPVDHAAVRSELGLQPGDRVVGTVGGIRPVKDHETLVRAFARVRQARAGVKLMLVGHDADGDLRRRVETEGATWGLTPGDVLFLGARHDVPELLGLMDVYVNSSLFEGTSNGLLEAMACRKPVVATAVGGNVDLITEGENGYLVPSSEPEAMADRIGRLLDDPDRAAHMGRRGRERVERSHDFDAMVAEHASLYEELTARARLRWRPRDRAKVAVTVLCRALGLPAARERAGGRVLSILSYHRVLPLHEKLRTPCQGMIVAKDVFERQIAALARDYRVLTLDETLRHVRERIAFPPRAVLITFDDGYGDNYRHAFPILRRYGVPATFFLTTGPIDSGRRLWWDEVDWAVRALGERLSGDEVDGAVYPDRITAALRDAGRTLDGTVGIDRLVTALNGLSVAAREAVVTDLRVRALRETAAPAERLMLTWDQVREMVRGGMSLGAHTINHVFLDAIDEPEGLAEIGGSLDRIAAETGVRPVAFAYPKGRTHERIRSWLTRCGVEMAVTTDAGVNRLDTDPLAFKRRDGGYLAVGDRFVASQMQTEMVGLWDRVRDTHVPRFTSFESLTFRSKASARINSVEPLNS
ncbi:MAG: glycosyltransferase [Nitrospiria bacterium]